MMIIEEFKQFCFDFTASITDSDDRKHQYSLEPIESPNVQTVQKQQSAAVYALKEFIPSSNQINISSFEMTYVPKFLLRYKFFKTVTRKQDDNLQPYRFRKLCLGTNFPTFLQAPKISWKCIDSVLPRQALEIFDARLDIQIEVDRFSSLSLAMRSLKHRRTSLFSNTQLYPFGRVPFSLLQLPNVLKNIFDLEFVQSVCISKHQRRFHELKTVDISIPILENEIDASKEKMSINHIVTDRKCIVNQAALAFIELIEGLIAEGWTIVERLDLFPDYPVVYVGGDALFALCKTDELGSIEDKPYQKMIVFGSKSR